MLQFAEQQVSDRQHAALKLSFQTLFGGRARLKTAIISLVELIVSGWSLVTSFSGCVRPIKRQKGK